MNFRTIFFYFFLQCFVITASAQYTVNIDISGYQDTALLLTSYFGDKIVLVDTSFSKSTGKFIFKGKDDLHAGIYMAVSQNKTKLFEFVVDDSQKFSLSTDTASFSQNMHMIGGIVRGKNVVW